MRVFSCCAMRGAAGLGLCLVLPAIVPAAKAQTKTQPKPAPKAASRPTADPAAFDPPLRQVVVKLGKVPMSDMTAKLTCYYFSSFAVKELDLGDEGAEWFSIVPARSQHFPACTRTHGTAEKIIAGKDWCGYFQGAKQGYVFLSACNAANGGIDFAVYDAKTGRSIFQDSAVDTDTGGLTFARAPDGGLLLKYLRVASFDCTLPTEKAACWSRIEASLGLRSAAQPACAPYEAKETGTVIVYPVEVALSAKPEMRPAGAPVRCHPPA